MTLQEKPEVLNELIRDRRSIFPQDYTGDRIDDKIVATVIDNARWAPTHRLTEPWRFVVFTGEGIKALAKVQSDLYRRVAEERGTFKQATYENLLSKPLLSSHIIAVLMLRDEKNSVPEVEETGAVFCALQNMYLSASAYGLGCYLSTGGITYFEEAKEYFGLGPDDRLIGFFHLGIPKREYPPGKRKPAEEISRWVTTADV